MKFPRGNKFSVSVIVFIWFNKDDLFTVFNLYISFIPQRTFGN